jgi:hypothetical protein
MTLNVNIENNEGTKNTARILSEFSRAMFSTGIVRHIKMKKRYFDRNVSALQNKNDKIRKMGRSAQLEQDIKDGKVLVNARGRVIKR